MPPLDEKQRQRVQGILDSLSDLLDKRFEQARRVNPIIANVERDVRLHMQESMRQILAGAKGFGPIKLVVADIFASADEEKKRALMSPTDQVSLMNEIVPVEDEAHKERRVGQLDIRDIKSLYNALNPSLEKIVELMQTWIWWDLRDASDIYRFDKQEERIQQLKSRAPDEQLVEYYRQEMGLKAGVSIERKQMVIFELQRISEIIGYFERRRGTDEGYQVIVYSSERQEDEKADALVLQLAERLNKISEIRQMSDPLPVPVRDAYAPRLNVPVDQVTASGVLNWETSEARRERQQLTDALFLVPPSGDTGNYKQAKLREMNERFGTLCKSLGTTAEAVRQAVSSSGPAPAASQEEAAPEEPTEPAPQQDQDEQPLMF